MLAGAKRLTPESIKGMMRMKKPDKRIGVYELQDNNMTFPQGIKWTRQRRAVYTVLWKAKEPLNAAAIYRLACEEGSGEEYAPSTIYRILAAFEEKGLVEKEADMADGNIFYSLCRGSHRHYAVCLECRKRIPLPSCPFAHIHMEKETQGFVIVDHKLEVYGYCAQCRTQ